MVDMIVGCCPGSIAPDEIDDEEDGQRYSEQPEQGVTDLPGFADELFDVFHDTKESPVAVCPRVSREGGR